MKDSILEFSSLHPAQLIGKKKQYISATNQDGIVNENRYSWQDTLSKEIIWDTGVGTLSPLVYSIPIYYGFQFASNGSPMLGSTMLIVGTILVFGDVIFMPISTLLEERKENSHISFSLPWYLNQFNDDSEATRHENVCFRRYQIKDDNALVGNTINLTGYSMAFDPVVMVRAEIEFEKKKISINYSFIIGKNRNLRTEDSFYPVTTYKCVKYKEILTFDGESIKSISSYDPDHILASKLTLGRMFDENSELNMVPHKQAQALLDALLKTKDYFESLNKKAELNTAPKQENSNTHTELPNEK